VLCGLAAQHTPPAHPGLLRPATRSVPSHPQSEAVDISRVAVTCAMAMCADSQRNHVGCSSEEESLLLAPLSCFVCTDDASGVVQCVLVVEEDVVRGQA